MTRKSSIHSKWESRQAGHGPSRTAVQVYAYSLYVVCLEAPAAHPDWQDKEWLCEADSEMLVSHNQSCFPGEEHSLQGRLENAVRRISRRIQANEGGTWIGRLRDAANDPQPERRLTASEYAGIRRHILAGPDTPARRYLVGLQDARTVTELAARLGEQLRASRKSETRVAAPIETATVAQQLRDLKLRDETPKEKRARALVERLKHPTPSADAFWGDRSDLGPAAAWYPKEGEIVDPGPSGAIVDDPIEADADDVGPIPEDVDIDPALKTDPEAEKWCS